MAILTFNPILSSSTHPFATGVEEYCAALSEAGLTASDVVARHKRPVDASMARGVDTYVELDASGGRNVIKRSPAPKGQKLAGKDEEDFSARRRSVQDLSRLVCAMTGEDNPGFVRAAQRLDEIDSAVKTREAGYQRDIIVRIARAQRLLKLMPFHYTSVTDNTFVLSESECWDHLEMFTEQALFSCLIQAGISCNDVDRKEAIAVFAALNHVLVAETYDEEQEREHQNGISIIKRISAELYQAQPDPTKGNKLLDNNSRMIIRAIMAVQSLVSPYCDERIVQGMIAAYSNELETRNDCKFSPYGKFAPSLKTPHNQNAASEIGLYLNLSRWARPQVLDTLSKMRTALRILDGLGFRRSIYSGRLICDLSDDKAKIVDVLREQGLLPEFVTPSVQEKIIKIFAQWADIVMTREDLAKDQTIGRDFQAAADALWSLPPDKISRSQAEKILKDRGLINLYTDPVIVSSQIDLLLGLLPDLRFPKDLLKYLWGEVPSARRVIERTFPPIPALPVLPPQVRFATETHIFLHLPPPVHRPVPTFWENLRAAPGDLMAILTRKAQLQAIQLPAIQESEPERVVAFAAEASISDNERNLYHRISRQIVLEHPGIDGKSLLGILVRLRPIAALLENPAPIVREKAREDLEKGHFLPLLDAILPLVREDPEVVAFINRPTPEEKAATQLAGPKPPVKKGP